MIGALMGAVVAIAVANENAGTHVFNFDSAKETAGWKLADGFTRLEPKAGRKGSTALLWSRAEPSAEQKAASFANIPAEPGGVYRLSGWMKQKDFTGQALIEMNWYDRNGKWMWFRAAVPVENNLVGDDGWRFFSALTKPLPANVGTINISCYARRGSKGQVFFDDIELVCADSKPIDRFATSAYRNEAYRGRVRFAASLNLNEQRCPLDATEAVLCYRDSSGGAARANPLDFAIDHAVFEIDASSFAVGTQTVSFVISDRRNRKEIASASLPFERLANPPRGRVHVDEYGRTIVDGKPFFPIGMMLWGMKDEDYDRYLSSPFNFGGRYGRTTRAELDRFSAKGKYLMVDLQGKKERDYGYLNRAVAELADHPGLLAWFVADEIEGDQVDRVSGVTKRLHELDPNHPTYGCHNKDFEMPSLLGCYDIGGMDAYPIGSSKGNSDIASVYRRCKGLADGAHCTIPMWHIPQTFDWTYYGRAKDPFYVDVRMPTRDEMANMTWQGVAAGGNGVMMYAYFELPRTLKGEAYERTWKEICSIGAELVKMQDVMLSVDRPVAMPKGLDAKKVAARSWRHRNREWTLYVNLTREAVSAVAELPASCGKLRIAVGAGASLADDRHVRLEFDPLGYAFVGMEMK